VLGKLLKHEWIATAKVLLPLNIFLILVTLIGKVIITIFHGSISDSVSPVIVILLTLYILILMALSVITGIYLVVRFYKNLFSNEGYLMFTLPVSTWSLLNSKLILSTFWCFITILNTIFSMFVLIGSALTKAGGNITYAKMDKAFYHEAEMHISTLLLLLCVFVIICSIQSMLMIYASIAIGQLFEKHKIIAAVIAYVIFYFIIQIISFVVGMGSFYNVEIHNAKEFQTFMYELIPISVLFAVVLSIIYYVTTGIIMKKKIDLD